VTLRHRPREGTPRPAAPSAEGAADVAAVRWSPAAGDSRGEHLFEAGTMPQRLPRATLSFYTVISLIDCHWLLSLRDLHSDLAVIPAIFCQNDGVAPGATRRPGAMGSLRAGPESGNLLAVKPATMALQQGSDDRQGSGELIGSKIPTAAPAPARPASDKKAATAKEAAAHALLSGEAATRPSRGEADIATTDRAWEAPVEVDGGVEELLQGRPSTMAAQQAIGIDVEVILTPPFIFCIVNH
jgi:hypothetical protein